MMSISMDNVSNHSHLPSKELVQRLFNKNVELENKLRKAVHARIPSDPSAWQKIRENYETILLEDFAFSEQHEIELALWQLHYRKIEELRARLSASRTAASSSSFQNGKGPTRAGSDRTTKIRSQFKTFLSEATGFYHDLMVKIRAKHGIPLDISSCDYESQMMSKGGNISADVKQSLISCHRCLIYLGDLARYKGSFGEPDFKAREYAAAASYYSQASSLWPSSGNPHHQLAILASYSGDELVTVYRYFRSLSVDNPFTTARDNLTIAFEKNRQSYSQLLGEAKASVKEVRLKMTGKGRGRGRGGRGEARVPSDSAAEATLVKERESNLTETLKFFKVRFVRLNGILFTRTSLETFEEVFSSAREDMLQLLSSGLNEEYNFGPDAAECTLVIIRMVAVLVFTVHNVKKECDSQSYAEILQRSLLLQHAFNAIFNFMGNILERCTQLSDPSTSYTLPGVLVFVEWLACHQDIAVEIEAEEKQNSARSSFWNLYVLFLNKLLASSGHSMSGDEDETCFFNMMSRYDETETTNRLALFEDFELRGFLPLVPAQRILDFSRKQPFGCDGVKEKQARVQRIIAAGKALANVVQVGQHTIYFDSKGKRFIIGLEPQVSDDHLITSSQGAPKGLEPMLQSPIEEEVEEEDEEIVFKPTLFEKLADGIVSKPSFSEVQHNNANVIEVGMGNYVEPVSASYNGSLFQNGLHNTIGPPSLASITNYCIQPAQPTPLVQSATSNKLANLSSGLNGFPGTLDLQDKFGAFMPCGLSVPFPHQSLNASSGIRYSVKLPEASVPFKFDSAMSLGSSIDCLSMKVSTIAPPGLKKNPVSRPVRHSGPPPGFSSVPIKQADVLSPDLALKSNHPMVDDYSWLDDYKQPSSNQGIGFNGTINQPLNLYHYLNQGSNSSAEVTSFPFPGKQIQPLHYGNGNQFSEQIRLYQEQQQNQKYGNGNQQSSAMPDQYQGQSLWEGRFLV